MQHQIRLSRALVSCLALSTGCGPWLPLTASEEGGGESQGTQAPGSEDDSNDSNDSNYTSTQSSTSAQSGSETESSAETETSAEEGESSDESGGGQPAGTPYVFVGAGDNIYAYIMDPDDGGLSFAGSKDVDAHDFIAVDAQRNAIFVAQFGSVSAYYYDQTLAVFNGPFIADSAGGSHVAVDPTGKYVFTTGYYGGELGFHSFSDTVGFSPAEIFVPGVSAHQARISASGTRVYVPCVGADHIVHYTLDPDAGTLSFASVANVGAVSGPRHMDLHPTESVAYVLGEYSSEIYVFDIDGSGKLIARAEDAVFTHEDEMYHKSSDIKVRPDGEFLYAINRVPPEIVRFRIETDASLTRLDATPLTSEVRAFAMDPAGRIIQAGGADGRLTAFQIHEDTGALTQTTTVPDLGDIRASEIQYLE